MVRQETFKRFSCAAVCLVRLQFTSLYRPNRLCGTLSMFYVTSMLPPDTCWRSCLSWLLLTVLCCLRLQLTVKVMTSDAVSQLQRLPLPVATDDAQTSRAMRMLHARSSTNWTELVSTTWL